MAGEGVALVPFLLAGFGGGLLLYAAVRSGTENRPTMTRVEAERAARRDGRDDDDGAGQRADEAERFGRRGR